MSRLKESPSQTAGPYVHIGCIPSVAGLRARPGDPDPGSTMISGTPEGQRITLSLIVLDGANDPLRDAMIEIWQPGPDGSFGPTTGFTHWGRQPTDRTTGIARFETLKPGTPDGQAPHILIWIVARGINLGLTTRLYFPDEDNSADPVHALAAERAHSLVAQPVAGGYDHVIHLQGPNETVFFDV